MMQPTSRARLATKNCRGHCGRGGKQLLPIRSVLCDFSSILSAVLIFPFVRVAFDAELDQAIYEIRVFQA